MTHGPELETLSVVSLILNLAPIIFDSINFQIDSDGIHINFLLN